jgi:hypothetical protein
VDFNYSEAALAALKQTITEKRLTHYLDETKGDLRAAMKLYALNLKVSESLYSPIQGLEICLRNSLNRVLIEKFGIDWIEERRVSLEPPQQEQIQNAIDSLRREGKPLSNGSLVAELSIGFWVGLLGPRYETSLCGVCYERHFQTDRRVERERKSKVR